MKITTLSQVVPPKGTSTFIVTPMHPIRVEDIRLTSPEAKLDIQYAQIGQVMLAAFRKRRLVCDPGTRVLVIVENDSDSEHFPTRVEIEGPEPEPLR
jgi:hypothetical protein